MLKHGWVEEYNVYIVMESVLRWLCRLAIHQGVSVSRWTHISAFIALLRLAY